MLMPSGRQIMGGGQLRTYILNRFPGDGDAAGLVATLAYKTPPPTLSQKQSWMQGKRRLLTL